MYSPDKNTPKRELRSRLKKLQHRLSQNNIDGALIMQNTDLYYFSGTIQQAHLYLPAAGEPILMVRKSIERARAESAIDIIVPIESPSQIPELLRRNGYGRPDVLGIEGDVLPANLYLSYQRLFEHSSLVDISTVIRTIRAVKSSYEIELIRTAAHFSDKVAGYVTEVLCEGITEIELAGKVEAFARKLGHQGIVRMRLWGSEMFYGHIMTGASAAVQSYLSSPTGGEGINPAVAQGPGNKTVRPYEPVLVDYVFAYQGYLSDNTRIFAIKGLADELLEAHAAMLKLQELLKRMAKPKVEAADIYRAAVEQIKQIGREENFMGYGSQRVRFVGHGIGLELDEYPFFAENQEFELQAGMTVALEPKLVFPGIGVVGIENTHVVTECGLEQLTCFCEDVIIV